MLVLVIGWIVAIAIVGGGIAGLYQKIEMLHLVLGPKEIFGNDFSCSN